LLGQNWSGEGMTILVLTALAPNWPDVEGALLRAYTIDKWLLKSRNRNRMTNLIQRSSKRIPILVRIPPLKTHRTSYLSRLNDRLR
jgi:hypothetical protein